MKIVGQMVCGPNERYLKKTLDEFKRLCDDVIVATCNADKQTIKLLDQYDFRHYEDNREWGKFQPFIKTDLLRRIIKLGTDWILVLDSDETIEYTTRADLESMSAGREACQFYVIDLWNDEQHYKKCLSFWNVRFYKADESKGVQFLKQPLHCGNAPPYFYRQQSAKQSYVPHLLIHRGLMLPADRQAKIRRYDLYDPEAVCKGREYYDALALADTGKEFNHIKIKESLYEFTQGFAK